METIRSILHILVYLCICFKTAAELYEELVSFLRMIQPKIMQEFLSMGKKKGEKYLIMNQIIWPRQLFNVKIDKEFKSI